jgi:hypothetical protein
MSQRRQYETWAEATADMFHYIEIFYNRERRHSCASLMSPEQFEIAVRKGGGNLDRAKPLPSLFTILVQY